MTGLPTIILVPVMATAGLFFGLGYFRVLRTNTRLWLTAEQGQAAALLLHVGRVAAAGAVFLGAALLGGAALLACFAGFLLARLVATRADRAAADGGALG